MAARVINGALLDINLAESVLSGATRISGAVNFVPADVRNKYPAIFTSKNTEFKQLKGSAGHHQPRKGDQESRQ